LTTIETGSLPTAATANHTTNAKCAVPPSAASASDDAFAITNVATAAAAAAANVAKPPAGQKRKARPEYDQGLINIIAVRWGA
jgi:hypothetical protein